MVLNETSYNSTCGLDKMTIVNIKVDISDKPHYDPRCSFSRHRNGQQRTIGDTALSCEIQRNLQHFSSLFSKSMVSSKEYMVSSSQALVSRQKIHRRLSYFRPHKSPWSSLYPSSASETLSHCSSINCPINPFQGPLPYAICQIMPNPRTPP